MYVGIRVIVELFKVYKSVICILGKNLIFQDVSDLFKSEEISIYRYGIVGLEVFCLAIVSLAIAYQKKTIKVFEMSEFDLIRENFTHDFYKKINDNSRDY